LNLELASLIKTYFKCGWI